MEPKRKSSDIVLLTCGHGMVDFYLNILPAVAPSLAIYLGLPLGDVVALIGISQFVTNAMQPLAGYIMGNRNLAWILWVGVIVSILPVAMGWATGLYSLAALVIVGAFGTGIFHPEGVLSAHDASGDNIHFGVPLFMAGGTFFTAAAAPVGIQWGRLFGYPSMILLGIPGIVIAALLLRYYRQRKREHPSVVMRPRSRRVTKIQPGQMSFWPLLAVSMCCGVATGLLFSIFSSHYELKFGPDARSWAGWVLMVLGGVSSLASFFWGPMAKRYGYYRVVLLTQILAIPGFYFLANASTPAAGFFIAIPLSLIAPAAVYPVAVTLSKNASGATQALRAGLVVGGTWGVASIVVTIAGRLLGAGYNSSNLILFPAVCSIIAAGLAVWQIATNAAGSKSIQG